MMRDTYDATTDAIFNKVADIAEAMALSLVSWN